MPQLATLEAIDPGDEMDVTLRVGELRVRCFAVIAPAPLAVGEVYRVAFTASVDEPRITEVPDEVVPSLRHTGAAYGYRGAGRIVGDALDADGVIIEEIWRPGDFAYLDGKMVTFELDRLDVEFLSD